MLTEDPSNTEGVGMHRMHCGYCHAFQGFSGPRVGSIDPVGFSTTISSA